MSSRKISTDLIEIVPVAMRSIRAEMRGIAMPELSVAQFRILSRIDHKPHSNKQLAEWAGVSTAAMSRTIEVLVQRGLVQRKAAENDRREVSLYLTTAGKRKYESIKEITKEKLVPRLEKFSKADLKKLQEGLLILMEVFRD